MSNKKDERIDDYTDEDVVEEVIETTEIPKQSDFFKPISCISCIIIVFR